MQTGNWLSRMFAPVPEEEVGPSGERVPDPSKPPKPGTKPGPAKAPRMPALSPDGEDVAALRKAEEQKALLAPAAHALSTVAQYFDHSGIKYNPDDLLSRKGFDIYQRMMIDEQVKAVVRFKMAAVLSKGWELYYPDDSELPEEERAERIRVFEAGIRNMGGSFKTGLQSVLRAMWQGFSITEKEHCRYEYRGKTWIGLKALMARPFDTFYFETDDFGHVEELVQRVGGKPDRPVPLNRVVYLVHNADMDAHYGLSDLREAYRAYYSKDMIIRFQNIYLERLAGGAVFLEQGPESNIAVNSPEWLAIQQLLNNLSTSTGAMLPKGVKANVFHPAATSAFREAIEAYNLAIAKALLVPNLLGITETGQTGTYSQSQTQFEAFLWTLDEMGSGLEECISEQVFKELGRANFADGEGPRFRMKPMSDSQREALLKAWGELIKAGAVEASDTDEKHVRKLIEFPEKGEPITKPGVILGPDGKPVAPQLGPDGKPLPPKVGPDGKPVPPPQPGETQPGAGPAVPAGGGTRPGAAEETLHGRIVRPHSRHGDHPNVVRLTAGERRFQFELARRKTESIEASSKAALRSAVKSGVGGMLEVFRKLGPDALAMEALEFDRASTSQVKAALKQGMGEAAGLGIRLAAGETGQAQRVEATRRPREERVPIIIRPEVHVEAPAKILETRRKVEKRDGDGMAEEVVETHVYEGAKK